MLFGYVNKMRNVSGKMVRWLWASAGFVFLAIGVVGTVVPLLPTTPFLLVAAWCFGKGSPRFRRAMEQHRVLGPVIRDWERYRVIPLYAKWLATFMVSTTSAYLLLGSKVPWWGILGAFSCFAILLSYIWTKPSQRPAARPMQPTHAAKRRA